MDIILHGTNLRLASLVETAVVLAQATYRERDTITEDTLFYRSNAMRDIYARFWESWNRCDDGTNSVHDGMYAKAHDDLVAAMNIIGTEVEKAVAKSRETKQF